MRRQLVPVEDHQHQDQRHQAARVEVEDQAANVVDLDQRRGERWAGACAACGDPMRTRRDGMPRRPGDRYVSTHGTFHRMCYPEWIRAARRGGTKADQ